MLCRRYTVLNVTGNQTLRVKDWLGPHSWGAGGLRLMCNLSLQSLEETEAVYFFRPFTENYGI